MAMKKFRNSQRFSTIFLSGTLILSLIFCLSVVYAAISTRLNVTGEGSLEIISNIDYYYYGGKFYTDSTCKETIMSRSKGSELKLMSDAVNQISDGRTIYMMSGYYTSGNETVTVSKKSVIIKRYKDEINNTKTFKNGPMFTSTSDFEINLADSTSVLIIDGNNIKSENSSSSNNLSRGGIIYSPSGSLTLTGSQGINGLIIRNHEGELGGIFKKNGNVSISNCQVIHNDVGEGNSILEVVSSSEGSEAPLALNCEINNCEFENNSGSAVISFNSSCDSNKIKEAKIEKIIYATVNNCNISDNSSTAIEFSANDGVASFSDYKVENCRVLNNNSTSNSKPVGGINFNKVGGKVKDCTVTGNNSVNTGVDYSTDYSTTEEFMGGVNVSDFPLTLVGKVIIKDNTLNGNTKSNLNFHPDYLITNGLTTGSNIGLRSYLTVPTESNPLTVSTKGNASSTVNYFFSDNELYKVNLNSGALQLVLPGTDYYYNNNYFYRDENLNIPVISANREKITKMSDAINQVDSGRIMHMMSGYKVSENEKVVVPKGKSVTIKKKNGFPSAIFTVNSNFEIDASDSTSSITIDGNNIEINNTYGGGFCVNSNSLLTLKGSSSNENFIVQNNKVKYGGFLGVLEEGEAKIYNVTAKNNYAQTGGSICNDSKAELTNCKILNSQVTHKGGGINCGGNSEFTTLENCTIDGNKSTNIGGGINVDGKALLNISNCTITNNSAQENGGGIKTSSDNSQTVKINNSTITGNTGNYGGGICCDTKIQLSGKMIVKDNKDNSGKVNNVYITINITISTKGLGSESQVGINVHQDAWNSGNLVVISYSGEAASTLDYFFSDDSNCEILFNDNLCLRKK